MSNTTTKKMSGKRIALLIAVFVILIAAIAVIYTQFSPKASIGVKAITIEVIDDKGKTVTYKENTDAKYLHQAMDELAKNDDTFSFDGTTSDTGMMIDTVNGLRADYTKDNAYWSILVNGDYGNYGIDQQPVTDKDAYTIEYTQNE